MPWQLTALLVAAFAASNLVTGYLTNRTTWATAYRAGREDEARAAAKRRAAEHQAVRPRPLPTIEPIGRPQSPTPMADLYEFEKLLDVDVRRRCANRWGVDPTSVVL